MKEYNKVVCLFKGHHWRWFSSSMSDATMSRQCHRCGYYEHYWTRGQFKPVLRYSGRAVAEIPSVASDEE